MIRDSELVGSVLDGQPEAYGELVRRHERAVMAGAAAVLRDIDSAHDAAQEAFLVAFEKLSSLRNRDAFGPWVARIGTRVALRMARERARDAPLQLLDRTDEPESSQTVDQTQSVLSAVMRLPEKQREAVLLRFFGGNSLKVIAEITNQPIGTVKSHISRAKGRLREWLEDAQE